MTEPRTRFFAALLTILGLAAGGFDAHLAPEAGGWWHGLTGSPSPARMAAAFLAGFLVWRLGAVISVRGFLGMGTGLLPLIPAATGFGSALLFFSGETSVLLFAILMGAACRPLIARMPSLEPLAVALLAFAFFVLVGRYLPGPAGPQGDEPHYLLIAESLLQDRDVDLKNQFDQRAFSKFTVASLEPHTAPRSPEGRLYSLHTPGLSAVIAPGYAWGGFAGARMVVSALMALVVGLLYFSTKSLFGPPAAGFVFLLSTFGSPLPIYANALFPDSVATLPVAATLACLLSIGPGLLTLATTTIALLPWLHPRFLPLALLLAFSLSIRDGFSGRRAALVFGPLLVSSGLLLFHFRTLFGSASLSAAYGPGFSSDVSIARIPWGASALLLDRQFGLLLFCPALLLALGGTLTLWRRNRGIGVLALAIFGLQLGIGGAFSMWWGGASAPARFLVGATPALLLLAGAYWRMTDQTGNGRLLAVVSGFGPGLLWLACLAPRTLHNRTDGGSALLRLLAPTLDLDRVFPGFVSETALWLAPLWAVILAAAMFRPRFAVAVVLPVGLALISSSTPLLDPFASSLRVLESWNDHRRCFGGADVRTAFTLDLPLGAPPWEFSPGVQRYSPRFSLPPGGWSMRVESRSEIRPGALNLVRLSLEGPDGGASALTRVMVQAGENVAIGNFDLETYQQRVNVHGEGLQSRATVLSVRLTPRPE